METNTARNRLDDMLERYGEVCTQKVAAQLLSVVSGSGAEAVVVRSLFAHLPPRSRRYSSWTFPSVETYATC